MFQIFTRRPVYVVIVVLSIVLGLLYNVREPARSSIQLQQHKNAGATPIGATTQGKLQQAAVAEIHNDPAPPSPGEQRAFQFILTGDRLDLTAIEETRGDFHRRRAPLVWQPGMIYGRLLDSEQRVLAEESLPAPDATCVVLDPHLSGATDEPQPARLTTEEPVVFQFRMPKVESATHLEIYRLTGNQPADASDEPVGLLLATISINP